MSEGAFRKDYIGTLDGLRACAVLLVLWQHVPEWLQLLAVHNAGQTLLGDAWPATPVIDVGWWRDRVFAAGYLGVDMFFVLSGFLITRILLVDKEREVPLRHFLMRRFLRIFPIYYLTLAVVWVVEPHPELPWCALYLSNFYYLSAPGGPLQHSWSLAVEEHFYLLWPWAVYLCATRVSRRIAAWGLVPLAVVSAVVLAVFYRDDLRFVMHASQVATMFRAGSLACGVLLAYCERSLRERRRRTLALALAFLAAGTALRFALPASAVGSAYALVRLVALGMTSTGLVMGAIALDGGRGPIAWLLRSGPLRFIGRISYGLYLYHYVVYRWMELPHVPEDLRDWPALALIVAAVAVSFAVATVSYFLVERPCLRLAARFRRS